MKHCRILLIMLYKISRIYWTLVAKCLLGSFGHYSRFEKPLKVSWRQIAIGKCVYIGHQARIEAITDTAKFILEDDCSIEQNAHIIFSSTLRIGSGTMISSGVFLSDTDHSYEKSIPPKYNPLKIKTLTIGKNCFIGAGAKILPGAILEDDVIIGANAVVLEGKYSSGTYVGVPARQLK